MNRILLSIIPITFLLAVSACTTTPQRSDAVEDARALVQQVEQDPMAKQVASDELKLAKEALNNADAAVQKRKSSAVIQHYAYVATRQAEIIKERIGEAQALARIKTSTAERNEVLLSARTQEADATDARLTQRERELRQSQIETDRARTLAEQSEREAALSKDQAEMALAEARKLQDELAALKAEQTARGLVMTLSGGLLFDTDKSDLKAGAQISMDRLTAFLKDHPERNVMIEGHTDSTGDASYNVSLSSRRAESVRTALTQRGIDANRIRANGLGESYPVATNDSVTGRQLNRRVEIVISDENGNFPAAAERSAYAN